MDGPKQVGTIGDIIAGGLSMAVYCQRADIKCWNHAEIREALLIGNRNKGG